MSNLIYKWASKYVDYKNKQQEAINKQISLDRDRVQAYILDILNSLKYRFILEFEKSNLRDIKPGDILLLNDYNFLDSRNKWDNGFKTLLHYKLDENMPSYIKVKSIQIATDYIDNLINEFIDYLSDDELKNMSNSSIVIKEFDKYCTNVQKISANKSFFKGVLYRKIEFEAYENFKNNIEGHVGMSEYTFLCENDLQYNFTKEILASDKIINNYHKQIDIEYEKRDLLFEKYNKNKV